MAVYFGNVGYIAAIATVFGVAMLPRARFLQTAAANCLAICLACAVNMLAMYTAIAARTNTTPPSTAPPQPGLPPYNSSQSAVSAIWLFAQVWAVNGVRVHWPSLNLPTVVYTIITSTSLSSSVRFTSVTQAENFSRELLVAFLGAQAIVIAISLLVFPLSCRTMALGKSMQLMGTLKGVMKAQVAYLEAIAGSSEEEEGGLEGDQATAGAQKTAAWTPWWKRRKARKAAAEDEDDTAGMAGPEAKVLKEAVHGAIQLFGALAADMEAAQTEFFWGKLSADDLGVLLNRLRDCLIPISGVQSLADISLRVYEAEAQDKEGGGEETLLESWKTIVAELQSPFTELTKLVADGFDHTTIVLGMTPPRPSVAKGDESSSEAPTDRPAVPGVPGFSAAFEARLQAVHEETRGILRSRSDAVKPVSEADPDDYDNLTRRRREPEAQAYLLLHTDTLMQAAGQAVLALMQFADAKVADGTMARNRLAVPNWLRLRKFFANVLSSDDVQADQGQDTITNSPTVSGISLVGDSFAKHRDPDHLPPANAFQSFGAAVSRGWGVVGSLDSVQGLRCAAAVMSVAIISFLEPTQEFFLRHRLVWAETIIILGMATSPGANVWGLVTRVVGTAVGVVLSLASWYIPDQHPAGVIVIQWLGMVLMYAVMMAFPKLLQGVFVGVVTTVMITGYELQVGVLGPAFVATALQEYQPIYELAPYRLATVAVGCFVAFVWSVFPYPVTERQIVRLELARGLHLLTESFGIAHSGLLWRTRLAQEGIDAGPDEEGRRKLQEMRRLLFRKMAVLLPDVRQHVAWQKWEPILGGSWPADTYNRIILRATRYARYPFFLLPLSLPSPFFFFFCPPPPPRGKT